MVLNSQMDQCTPHKPADPRGIRFTTNKPNWADTKNPNYQLSY